MPHQPVNRLRRQFATKLPEKQIRMFHVKHLKTLTTRYLSLPRFRGHFILGGGGTHDARIKTSVPGRVPATDGGSGPVRAQPRPPGP